MKKKIFIIASFFLALIMILAPTKEKVLAQNSPECVAVIGVGEVCVNPTIAEIRFMIICKENSIAEVANCAKEKLQNITNALSEIDANISNNLSTEISSVRPIFENGVQVFEQRDCFIAKTTEIESVNEILSSLVSNGALFRGEISYSVEDYSSQYSKALEKAKQNAIEKASLFGSNLKLEKICEDYYCYSCFYSSANNCIKIEARVKAIFEKDESLESETESENIEENEQNNESVRNMVLLDKPEVEEVENNQSQTENTEKDIA